MINIRELGKQEAVVLWNNYQENGWTLPELNGSYLTVRNDLVSIYNKVSEKGLKIKSYEFDVEFALDLFKYFSDQGIDNLRTASNDGFWRYLSLVVIPNIVKSRWDKEELYRLATEE